MHSSSIARHALLAKLADLLDNPGFPAQLSSTLARADIQRHEQVYLRIDATVCFPDRPEADRRQSGKSLTLGVVDLRDHQAIAQTPEMTASPSPDPSVHAEHDNSRSGHVTGPLTPQSISQDESSSASFKRRKTVSGLRPSNASVTATILEETDFDSDVQNPVDMHQHSHGAKSSTRQLHSDTRFPQRKKPVKKSAVPVMQPSSVDKLISGIWRQLHSPLELSLPSPYEEPQIDIRTGVSGEVFLAMNRLCVKYYNQNQSSRAVEMIVQAYWIECYQARIASICLENPNNSITEARMMALKEACSALGWREKELRNRMAIWRGYKEIKDSGGWASLIFAGTGVYRFCKYRIGFNEGLASRLRHLSSSLEVAADTLHPGWRSLLQVINQDGPPRYQGHPHEWVIVATGPAIPLSSTYDHLQLSGGFNYRFVAECVVDQAVFGADDPRQILGIDPDNCPLCKERQSDDVKLNRCSCWPNLFGGVHPPVPVQLFHTGNGKNNGVIARCQFDRGTGIAEFVGLVTLGIEGLDVMVGSSGSREKPYQIFQGQMGNFTRFINHSCHPNSQFQKFVWRGKERIIIVSRGVPAGSEITVDYSDYYWEQLNKNCLCGEPGCRFARQI